MANFNAATLNIMQCISSTAKLNIHDYLVTRVT